VAERRLSNKQRVFVEEYLRCWNASEAARRAGYKGNVDVAASRLLVNASIQALIKARLAEKTMSADAALARLTEQARAAYADYLKDNGEVDLQRMLADGKGHLIKGYKWFKGELTVEFYDAQAALGQIARAHGLFVDKTALTDPSGKTEYGDHRAELERRLADLEAAARAASVPGEPQPTRG